MKNHSKLLLALALLILSVSCKKDDEAPVASDDANQFIMDNVILPAGSFIADASNITESSSIELIGGSGGSGMQVVDDQTLNVSIPFSDPTGSVTHAGIAFGDPNGQVWMVPISGAQGNTAGTLSFDMQMPPGICANLSEICHDIKCYEFAVSKDASGSSFRISKSNINQLVSACGQCDEPSCTSLLGDNCGASGGDGDPRFNLTWSPVGVDLDLYVIDPDGEELNYTNSSSVSGGELDVDCIDSCTDENITWVSGGPNGKYTYYVQYFEGSERANWSIRVFDGNKIVGSQTGTLGSGTSPSYTYNR